MIISGAALVLAALVHASSPAPPPTPAATAPTTVAAAPTTTGVTTTVPSGPTTTIPIPEGYVPLVDDSHTIAVAVPPSWQDVNTTAFIPEEGTAAEGQPSIVASPDIQKFYTSFDVPGLSYFAVPYTADPLTIMDQYGLTSGCTSIAFKEYDDPVFVGVVQVGSDCGPQHMTWNMVVANPADHAFTAVLQVQTADPAELEVVLRTFNVAP
jgi:hypothetical protein